MSKSPRRPNCNCPACKADYYTAADGVFYCVIDNDWTAYAAGQFVGAGTQAHAAEALAVYRIDQAAAEADMVHDVEQAATDSDFVAALADTCYCTAPIITCPGCGDEKICSSNSGCVRHYCLTCQRNKRASVYMQAHRLDSGENPGCGARVSPTEAHADIAAPEYPAFLYYDRRQGGVVWAGSPTAYPSYIEAALARDGK